MTAPTIGFGLVVPRPRSARSSARFMYSRSESMLALGSGLWAHPSPFGFKQRIHILIHVERHEIVDGLADADIADGQLQLACDGDGDAALRRTVELGQHDAVDAGHVHELACLTQSILTNRGVEHEEYLVRRARHFARSDAANFFELVHQIHLRMKASGRIDEDWIASLGLARCDSVKYHRCRI